MRSITSEKAKRRNNFGAEPQHSINQSNNTVEVIFVPFLLDSLHQLGLVLVISRPDPPLQLFPEVLDGVQVGILRGRLGGGDIVVAQALLDEARRVFGIVVVLKDLSS